MGIYYRTLNRAKATVNGYKVTVTTMNRAYYQYSIYSGEISKFYHGEWEKTWNKALSEGKKKAELLPPFKEKPKSPTNH